MGAREARAKRELRIVEAFGRPLSDAGSIPAASIIERGPHAGEGLFFLQNLHLGRILRISDDVSGDNGRQRTIARTTSNWPFCAAASIGGQSLAILAGSPLRQVGVDVLLDRRQAALQRPAAGKPRSGPLCFPTVGSRSCTVHRSMRAFLSLRLSSLAIPGALFLASLR